MDPSSPFRVHATPGDLNVSLGTYICSAAAAAIAERGHFVLFTSGGSLPASLASSLAWAAGSGLDLQTSLWHIFYADERHVALTSSDSNHAATLAALGSAPWFQARLHPIDPALPLPACAAAYQAELQAVLAGTGGGIDLVLLGMGPDGHTASLFPGHALLQEGQLLVAPIADSPKPPPSRVTLTLPAINASARVAFVALGEAKAPLVAAIAQGTPEAKALPAAMVRQATGPATWFLDAASAQALPKQQGN